MPDPAPIPIIVWAASVLKIDVYDWQANILMDFERGNQTAAACANFTGKTGCLFPICALWMLYSFPRSRVMYLSATGVQVRNQFMSSLNRFRTRPAFAGWQWLETEVRNPQGGFLFGRSSDTGGHVEGLHDQPGSPAALLVDEAKSIDEEVLDALSRCHTSYRLYASSTGQAFGHFYRICTAEAHLWKTYRIPSSMCPHVSPALIAKDRENLKDNVFRIKHGAEWLYDAGDSMISLEHVRSLLEEPPEHEPGDRVAYCDFAGSGDESVLAMADGNRLEIVDTWRSRDTMHSVGKFLNWFKKLGLQGYQIGGDEGYGHQLMDRMDEEGFRLQRFNNGSPAERPEIYANLSAEWWSKAGELIARRQVLLPSGDEKLVAQLTSRRRFYDSRGREKLESKADLRSRGVESPDRADGICGAIAMLSGRHDGSDYLKKVQQLVGRNRLSHPLGPTLDFGTPFRW
jgi:hypothetical protein